MKLVPTCERPEQYLIVHQRQPVGHLRLWDGYFCAHYPNVLGRIVYEARTRGNLIFENSERQEHLDAAKLAIQVAWEADQEPLPPRERVAFTSTEVAASLSQEAVRVDARLTDLNAAFAQIQSAGAHWSGMSETLLREMIAMRPLPVHGSVAWIPLTSITGRCVEPGVEYVRGFPNETPPTPTPDQL